MMIKRLSSFCLALILFSCTSENKEEIDNLWELESAKESNQLLLNTKAIDSFKNTYTNESLQNTINDKEDESYSSSESEGPQEETD
jgi:hypothetical protein